MKRQAVYFIIGLISTIILIFASWELLRYGVGVFLIWILPALIWEPLFSRDDLSLPERIAIVLGLSFVNSIIVVLVLAYLPGQITVQKLLIGLFISLIIPVLLNVFLSSSVKRTPDKIVVATNKRRHTGWLVLLLILFLAAGTRFINLGYSEFQGDEADVVVKAAHVLTGDTAVLFQHKKGPAEILLVAAGWGVTGITNEWMARLPFAFLSILGIGVIFHIGRRLSRPEMAAVTALLLAVEGYLVGFGRIVQYQSIVYSLSALAILSLILYYEYGHGRYLILAAVFFAGAALAHYDAILALPAGLLLIGGRIGRDRQNLKIVLPGLVVALLVGALLVGIFYWPYLRGSQFGATTNYLLGRIGSGQTTFNHLSSTFERTAVYDNIYFLILIVLAVGFQTLYTWRGWVWFGVLSAFVVLLAAATVFVWPEAWQRDESSLAWIPFTVWFLGSLIAPKQSILQRAVWLWFAAPFLFYSFFVALPLTHIYTAVPGAILLAGEGLANFTQATQTRAQTIRRVINAGSVVVYLLSVYYVFILFIDHTPEYVRNFPESKSPLFWTPYVEIPKEGRFGFPYRAGWKAVGYQMDTGQLNGSYDSNEEHEITDYYTRQAVRINCARPDLFVTAVNVQDEVPIRTDQLENEFEPSALIYVSGQPKITIYRQNSTGALENIDVKSIDWQFDQGTTPERVASTTVRSATINPDDFISKTAYFGDFAQLLGYQLNTSHAVPGGYIELTLLWQAIKPAPINYQVFTHLHDGTTMRGQLDGQPACGNAPTSRWQAGQQIVDPYRIPINADAAAGVVPLSMGLYDLATLQRLPVYSADGVQVGDNVVLTEVDIQAIEAGDGS